MKKIKIALVLIFSLQLTACDKLFDFQKQADNSFGDQHFKTAISLIELHKIRFGEYPETLEDIQFSGQWDMIALQSVSYKKSAQGYDLDVVNGWVGKPELEYPKEFWQGLGIQESNMK
jgi:hypothetical protein